MLAGREDAAAAEEAERRELRAIALEAKARAEADGAKVHALQETVAQLQTLVMQQGSGVGTLSSEVCRLREHSADELADVRTAAARAQEHAEASANACAVQELAAAREKRAVQDKLDTLTHGLRVLSEHSRSTGPKAASRGP